MLHNILSLFMKSEISPQAAGVCPERPAGNGSEKCLRKPDRIRRRFFYISAFLLLLTAGCQVFADDLVSSLPGDSCTYSAALAREALKLSEGYTAESQALLAENAGFEILLQKNFDKDTRDPAHTCAYTIGRRLSSSEKEGRSVYLVLIRGTSGGEWYSNFDFAPSRDAASAFAENFLYCAEDVFLELQQLAEGDSSPIFFVCGHSRGAACSNLLGVLLNEVYDPANVYVYTSATPMTVREDALDSIQDDNIFNIINPCDLVPRLPLAAWGYTRAGTDIFLKDPGTAAVSSEKLDAAMETLADLSPTVTDYYETRHSLTKTGTDEASGFTAFDMMIAFADSLVRMTEEAAAQLAAQENTPDDPDPVRNESAAGVSEPDTAPAAPDDAAPQNSPAAPDDAAPESSPAAPDDAAPESSPAADTVSPVQWSSLQELNPESDFAPLMGMFAKLADNDGREGFLLLEQHMPDTYSELLEEM